MTPAAADAARMTAGERRASFSLASIYALRMLGLFLVLPVLAFLGWIVAAIWLGDWLLGRMRGTREAGQPSLAAVVGVILNLALFFAYHVLWPQGFAGNFDLVSALITLAAALALFRFKQSVIRVIAASALLGLALKLLGV